MWVMVHVGMCAGLFFVHEGIEGERGSVTGQLASSIMIDLGFQPEEISVSVFGLPLMNSLSFF